MFNKALCPLRQSQPHHPYAAGYISHWVDSLSPELIPRGQPDLGPNIPVLLGILNAVGAQGSVINLKIDLEQGWEVLFEVPKISFSSSHLEAQFPNL